MSCSATESRNFSINSWPTFVTLENMIRQYPNSDRASDTRFSKMHLRSLSQLAVSLMTILELALWESADKNRNIAGILDFKVAYACV